MWFAALLSSICFEGLGRKFIPSLSASALYFTKDVVLLWGLIGFGVRVDAKRTARKLYGGFALVLLFAFLWTVAECANPRQASFPLALLGLRAYWLWWIAPLVVASALRDDLARRRAVRVLAVVTIVVAAQACFQFAAPADAPINEYAWGAEEMGIAVVHDTSRVRVTSTFSFITGFGDFCIIALAVLVPLGLGDRPGRSVRTIALVAIAAIATALPMSGSRAPLVLGALVVIAGMWGAGYLRPRAGLRLIAASVVAVLMSAFVVPEAGDGVRARFGYSDTEGRFADALQVLPPVAMIANDYPMLGSGTGMQQNARIALGVATEWDTELEPGRHLVELGAPGYLLVWVARVGLVVALLRAARSLKRSGRLPLRGLALALAAVTMLQNITFDHIGQALYFICVGLVLQGATPAVTPKGARRSEVGS